MHIIKVLSRIRNDFQFNAYCRHCEKVSFHGDGYADQFYQEKVLPARHCPHCGRNEIGRKPMLLVLESDIGRKVIYTPVHGEKEVGVISSFSDTGVFVRFGSDTGAKLCSRADLEFES